MKSKVLTILIFIVLIAIWGYSPVKSLYTKRCRAKYGKEYNSVRKELGVPLLVDSWHVDTKYDNANVWGVLNGDVIGHKRKTLIFDGCDIAEEQDVYQLPIENGEKRWIEMSYKYKQAVHKDSIQYQVGSYAKLITKIKADSILDAEHINGNY